MRPDPLGFPKDKGVAGLPGEAGPAVGLHAKHDVFVDQFVPDEFTPDFRAPAVMEPFIKYGREIGVHVSSFSLPGIWFEQKPEWGSVNENGKPTVYIWGRKVACPACDEYMQHMLALHQSVFAKYEPRWWGWDGRWMSHWEVPKYRPGPKGAGLDPCFAKNHGHLPGDNYYKEWKNIQGFLAELRRRFPQMCLEEYCGLKRGGPWALQHLSADDNYYETNGADMNRLQTWHNENDRFRPVYKNYAAIFGNNAKSFQFNVISTISTTAYCQIGPGYAGLAQPENQEFLKKWRAWATENHAYLKVKRNLFECPGYAPIDGSAHVLKDRGFLFLFPGGFDIGKTHDKTLRASIPLTRWIGLEEKAGATYKLVEVYPREGRVLATCRYGETLLYDMPDNSAVILALTPAAPGETIESASFDPKADKVEGVPAFSETFPEFPKPNDRKN